MPTRTSTRTLALARELQAIGFTLADVVDALAPHDAGGATCESEQWRLEAVLTRVDAKLAELSALRRRILQALDACADGHCRFTTPTRPDSR
jgi:DNA-binding transcriptional MerR regulator